MAYSLPGNRKSSVRVPIIVPHIPIGDALIQEPRQQTLGGLSHDHEPVLARVRNHARGRKQSKIVHRKRGIRTSQFKARPFAHSVGNYGTGASCPFKYTSALEEVRKVSCMQSHVGKSALRLISFLRCRGKGTPCVRVAVRIL